MNVETALQMNRRLAQTRRQIKRAAWWAKHRDTVLSLLLLAMVLADHLIVNSLWFERWASNGGQP